MVETPGTIRVTHDELAASILRAGKNLIELGLQLQEGLEVVVGVESKVFESDERVKAWYEIAGHPFFRGCYSDEGSLLDAMILRLDRLTTAVESSSDTTEAS